MRMWTEGWSFFLILCVMQCSFDRQNYTQIVQTVWSSLSCVAVVASMMLAPVTLVNSGLTVGKWTYDKVGALSLQTGERGVYHPSKAFAKTQPKVSETPTRRWRRKAIISYNLVVSTVHCLIFVYFSFQMCLIFLSKSIFQSLCLAKTPQTLPGRLMALAVPSGLALKICPR